MKDIIADRKIAVVDDSIVRGTTSRHIVHMLKEYGAKEVYFVSASPPVKYPCIYGIDMSVKKELIAAKCTDCGSYLSFSMPSGSFLSAPPT